MTSHPARGMAGRVRIPGDSSIAHCALIMGALATGRTRIEGLVETEDVLLTTKALVALGVPVTKNGSTWEVLGRGIGGMRQPAGPLDFGHSIIGSGLMMAVIAGQPITVTMTGDGSASKRPLTSFLRPLRDMGLQVTEGGSDTLPLTLRGCTDLVPIRYELPVACTQVKSAVLLAGLAAAGETTVVGQATWDGTERLLKQFGAEISSRRSGSLAETTITGETELKGCDVVVSADPSLAAFAAAAALIVPESDVVLEGLSDNAGGRALFDTLIEMGADLTYLDPRTASSEAVFDVRVRWSRLRGVTVPAQRAALIVDDYPILAVASSFAHGITRLEGLAGLDGEGSERLAATVEGLRVNGVPARRDGDSLIVEGCGPGSVMGGGTVATRTDDRIAMAFLAMGLASTQPVTVDNSGCIETRFKDFKSLMEGLGATFS